MSGKQRSPRSPWPARVHRSGGAAGAAGQFSAKNVSYYQSDTATACASGGGDCAVISAVANCPSGAVPIGGGWAGDSTNPPIAMTMPLSAPTQHGWGVIGVNQDSADPAGFVAVVGCAKAGSAAAATARASAHAASPDAMTRLVRQLRGRTAGK